MSGDENALRVIQIGANTSDIPATLHLYAEAFGFHNAGCHPLWGKNLGIQGLPLNSHALVWWMVGAQDFFQLEFFHHTQPLQRPKRVDWHPADHGWNRFGISVPDFDACLTALAANGLQTFTEPMIESGLRRVAFRDPYLAVIVEVLEKPTRSVKDDDSPDVVYATSSVADLESAQTFYRDVLQLEIVRDQSIHAPHHEALWGMAGARLDAFLVRAGGGILLEIVQYREPSGRPRPDDYRISDQGIVNVCLGSRDGTLVGRTLERAIGAGIHIPAVFKTEGIVAGYLIDRDKEIELAAIPESLDARLGFLPQSPFPA
jgi:catechol 2,3-dioxygenase-like lactoylglutathione lyase family enzyme